MTFSKSDTDELNTLYASANLPTPTGTIQADITPLPGHGNAFVFTAQWHDGPTIPLVQIGTNGAPVSDITADGFGVGGTSALNPNSAGWFLLDPSDPRSLAGYMEDAKILFSGEGGNYLTFVNLSDPLGPEKLTATFGFTSPTGVGTVLAFLTADNFITTRGRSAVPEPPSASVLALGMVVLIAWLRIRNTSPVIERQRLE